MSEGKIIQTGKLSLGPSLTTQHWVDLYGMLMERLSEHLANPKAFYQKLGIDPKSMGSAAQKIGKLDMDAYHDLQGSWKRVSKAIMLFGLELGDDLQLSPSLPEMGTKEWQQNPWLVVSRATELDGLRFEKRDALTALSFFNFYIQQCETLDPVAHMRSQLEAQGITADNWYEHAGRLGITNPFTQSKKD